MAQSFALWPASTAFANDSLYNAISTASRKPTKSSKTNIDPIAVQAALEKLKQHPEPEAGFMLVRQTALPAYNIQTAVDANMR